jgi:lipopolysaccharide transport system permease protein
MITILRARKTRSGPQFTVYERRRGWTALNLREFWKHRGLLFFLALRDIKVRYRQTVLGIAWVAIQPLTTMVVFTAVFNKMLGVQSPDPAMPYAVFSLSGVVIWQYFSMALGRSSASLVSQANLITKVYFPRLILPVASILSGLVDLLIALVILLVMMAAYGILPGWEIIFLILFVILAMATVLSVGLWAAALNVLYRDVAQIMPFLVQVWMFLSPVIYPLSQIQNQEFKIFLALNPMAQVLDGFRWALLGQPFDTRYLWYSVTIVVVLLVGGLFFFRRTERLFADLV